MIDAIKASKISVEDTVEHATMVRTGIKFGILLGFS